MSMPPGSRRRDYSANPDDPNKQNSPKFVNPHSPWQLAIEQAREEQGMSIRALAEKASIPSGTIFNWIRSVKGHPDRKNYPASVNTRLAKALGLDPKDLLTAYNSSAVIPVPAPRAPRPDTQETSRTVVERVVAVLKQSGKTHFTISDIRSAGRLIR